ncbi:MAG: hypothetical protein AAF329_03635 [Cyanobacteria bacterium P01_A01_bin.17]
MTPIKKFFRLPSSQTLILVATVSLLLDASLKGILFSTLLLAIAFCLIWTTTTRDTFNHLAKWSSQTRRRRFAVRCLPSLILLSSYVVCELTLAPAHAQFLQGAENFITTLLTGANVPANLVALIFGVLRAIFVIYIAIAVIRVLVAARNDDDWTTLARTPLIIVMAIVIGDLMANLVIGGGTATP